MLELFNLTSGINVGEFESDQAVKNESHVLRIQFLVPLAEFGEGVDLLFSRHHIDH